MDELIIFKVLNALKKLRLNRIVYFSHFILIRVHIFAANVFCLTRISVGHNSVGSYQM